MNRRHADSMIWLFGHMNRLPECYSNIRSRNSDVWNSKLRKQVTLTVAKMQVLAIFAMVAFLAPAAVSAYTPVDCYTDSQCGGTSKTLPLHLCCLLDGESYVEPRCTPWYDLRPEFLYYPKCNIYCSLHFSTH